MAAPPPGESSPPAPAPSDPDPTDETLLAETLDEQGTERPQPVAAEDERDRAGTPFGRYRLLEELGRGGMGVVWKAWDTELKRVVALKQILEEAGVDAAQRERFMREARAAAKLKHPGIVGVHDVGVQEGQHYFTADYVDGRPLDLLMREEIPVRRALAIVKAVAEALHYAHEEGIVHRDIKPANIIVDAEDRPYVTDFGLAKDIQGIAGSGLTVSGSLLGTPRYMSPEQATGRTRSVGPASDQFSLGVVLYELLTGCPPFEGESLRAEGS